MIARSAIYSLSAPSSVKSKGKVRLRFVLARRGRDAGEYKPYVRGLAAPCPRCEKLTIATEGLIDEDLTVYILFRCKACGERWEKVNSVDVTVEEWDSGGRPPAP